jgi:predicted HTH domain antitoxin
MTKHAVAAARERVSVELRRDLAEEWRALGPKKANKYLEQTMVLSLVRSHQITMSRGAELLGMHYQDFLDLLAANDVAVLDYRPGEVGRDVKTLKRYVAQRPRKA